MPNINDSFKLVKKLMASYGIAVSQDLDTEDFQSVVATAIASLTTIVENTGLLICLNSGDEVRTRDVYFEGGDLMTSGLISRPQRIPLSEIAAIITEYTKTQLNLYAIDRKDPVESGEYVSCVVAAENPGQAYELSVEAFGRWVSIEDQNTRLIGVATDGLKKGVVLSSYVGV